MTELGSDEERRLHWPWLLATAIVLLVLAFAVFADNYPGQTDAYLVGAFSVPAFVPAVVMIFVARSNPGLQVWQSVGAAVGIAVLWYAVTEGQDLLERRALAEETGGRVLSFPAAVGDWSRTTGTDVESMTSKYETTTESHIAGDVEMAQYARPADGVVALVTFIVPEPGSGLADEQSDPASVVNNLLAGQGVEDREVVDAGSLGGAMRCGSGDRQGETVLVCVWADATATAYVVVPASAFDGTDDVADLTRQFREAMTSERGSEGTSTGDEPESGQADGSAADVRSLMVPDRVGGWRLADDDQARRTARREAKRMRSGASGVDFTVSLYEGRAAESVYIVTMQPLDPEASAGLVSANPQADLDKVLREARTEGARSFAPGALGGVLSCASAREGGNSSWMCGWADPWTMGLIVVDKLVLDSIDDARRLTVDFREAMTIDP